MRRQVTQNLRRRDSVIGLGVGHEAQEKIRGVLRLDLGRAAVSASAAKWVKVILAEISNVPLYRARLYIEGRAER